MCSARRRSNFYKFLQEEVALKEQEIIEKLKQENEEFKRLSEEHKSLDSKLVDIDKKRYLNSDEEIERKKLQKQKLIKKDKMAQLIRDYRRNLSSN